jgi:CRP/FNR family transcriptional regulator, cyclic AMP receptor protein
MFIIQAGKVEVVKGADGSESRRRVLRKGDFFGEMALFGSEHRTATVRAVGEARVLTVDKRTLLRRIQEDPSFAFKLLETMSQRIQEISSELVRAKNS